MINKISRCLISVSDKSGLDAVLEILRKFNIKTISTGGTYKYIKEKNYECTEISSYTSSPEILDGRVKTLHPKIHGGILNVRQNKIHQNQLKDNKIQNIDLVIVNLYPFENKLKEKVIFEDMIENIDIGGPSMLRSAAKNFKDVTVIPSSSFYKELIEELKSNDGATSLDFRKKMANETFNETAFYDSLIANWMNNQNNIKFPQKKTIPGKLIKKLRYGENPHQESCVFEIVNENKGFSNLKQVQGKELSHNNYLDSFNAYSLVNDFNVNEKVCAIIKHNNPCGCSLNDNGLLAFQNALDGDPTSAFGGVVAFNFEINDEIALKLTEKFYEVVLCPKINNKAKSILATKKNLRVLEYNLPEKTQSLSATFMQKTFLLQDENIYLSNEKSFQVVTKAKPTTDEIKNLLFANQVCKHVKSNAIVICNKNKTLGIGCGQTSRVGSSKIACESAKKNFPKQILGSSAASDAFFPFADGLESLVKLGVKSIIQPGGSIKDKEVIEAADKADVSMVFTGVRNFKH